MNLFDIEMPTDGAEMLAKLFNMPPEIRYEIILDTDTIKERNKSIIMHCFMFYITKKYKLYSIDDFTSFLDKGNPQKIFDSFFDEANKRMKRYNG
jgi:hypothetical protein